MENLENFGLFRLIIIAGLFLNLSEMKISDFILLAGIQFINNFKIAKLCQE